MSAILLFALWTGWGSGPCVAVAMPQAQRTQYEWRAVPDRPDEFALMRDGRQIGSYSQDRNLYRPYDRKTDSWGEPCEPPVAAPVRKEADAQAMIEQHPEATNFGIDLARLTTGREKVSISGREITTADPVRDAIKAIEKPGGGTIPDDGGKPWLVWVGDAATGDKIKADLRTDKLLSPWKDAFRVKSYRVGEAMAVDRDGQTTYTPGVWLVSASGQALSHMNAYLGPAQLAKGIRRAHPDWDPAKVPDTSKQPDPVVPDLTRVPVWQVGAGLGVAGILFFVGRWLLRLAPLLLPLLSRPAAPTTPPATPAPAPQPAARRPSKEALEAARALMEGRK